MVLSKCCSVICFHLYVSTIGFTDGCCKTPWFERLQVNDAFCPTSNQNNRHNVFSALVFLTLEMWYFHFPLRVPFTECYLQKSLKILENQWANYSYIIWQLHLAISLVFFCESRDCIKRYHSPRIMLGGGFIWQTQCVSSLKIHVNQWLHSVAALECQMSVIRHRTMLTVPKVARNSLCHFRLDLPTVQDNIVFDKRRFVQRQKKSFVLVQRQRCLQHRWGFLFLKRLLTAHCLEMAKQ